MKKTTVHQISIVSKPESTFYLKLEWTKDIGAGFVVLLCDGIFAWSGEVSEEDVTREAQELEMPREIYVKDLQLALTGEGQASQNFTFHLEPNQASGPNLRLTYEREQCDMSFRFGMVELLSVPDSTEVIKDLICYGLERGAYLETKNYQLQEENQRLKNEQKHITAEMERYVQGKDNLEGDLYRRFVLVLNEKKATIRALQEKIKQLQDNTEEKKRWKTAGTTNQKGENAFEEGEEESDYGNTTDEDEKMGPKPPSQNSANEELASNPVDESLSDIADVAPSRKRRQRHLQHLEPQSKRQALEQRQTVSENKLPKEEKAEISNATVQKPAQVSPDPDHLFDDI
ncbi:DNA repair protein XRCC4 [Trichomycterus rosablanca]|uniref:DNA repair protein XRCC4 n=1 Tax=Trichomycterus rosablanca TaxID=2290929 RepID=UPI002F35AB02